MRPFSSIAMTAGAVVCLAACSSGGSSSSSTTVATSAAPAHTALPANAKTPVTFAFTDVSVATAGANTLRLGFDIDNEAKDPLLCDSSEFYVQLSDGTVLPADGSAENSCDPDSVDPGATGKAVMFFDLPGSYTGPLTVMVVIDDKIVGQGTTIIK